ncbi:hypothetical protein GYMLUDRAFT_55354 [Collybiopsis luxurians FD-317 M1]|nr:hypothetical protein GYMLUDRAFT_55354 [Collybiopsis luxurians FD-317 M1]
MENGLFSAKSTFGPIFFGVFFNAILCGALFVQASHELRTSSDLQDSNTLHEDLLLFSDQDARWIQFLVFFLLIAEIVDSGVVFSIAWQLFIENYDMISLTMPLSFIRSAPNSSQDADNAGMNFQYFVHYPVGENLS